MKERGQGRPEGAPKEDRTPQKEQGSQKTALEGGKSQQEQAPEADLKEKPPLKRRRRGGAICGILVYDKKENPRTSENKSADISTDEQTQ
jgi:hypothetical protein